MIEKWFKELIIGTTIFIVLLIISCENKPKNDISPKDVFLPNCDSIISKHNSELTVLRDSFNMIIVKNEAKHDILLDSIGTELILVKFKIERVRKYYNICKANPTQDKFLKGWVGRAIQ